MSRSPAERLRLLAAHGDDPNGYALLQPDMEYFDHGEGFLAYRTSFWTPVVLDDPVAPREARADLVRAFLDAHPRAIFYNASGDFAAELAGLERGYRFAPFGTERVLDIGDEAFLESKKIRGALKKAKKGKLALEEVDPEDAPADRLELLRAVNQEFLDATPSKKEITFISRGVRFERQEDVRLFALRCTEKGETRDFGFVVLDPYYAGGAKVGYQLNAIRFRRTKIWGVYFAVVATLARLLREEGATRLSLGGLAYDLVDEPSPFPHDPKMVRRMQAVKDRTDEWYVMSHFTDMKLELGGDPIRRYTCLPARASVTRSIVRFLRVSGMV